MDTNTQDQHPATSDDQELAKVLAGVDQQAEQIAATPDPSSTSGLQFEETPLASSTPAPADPTAGPATPLPAPQQIVPPAPEEATAPATDTDSGPVTTPPPVAATGLEAIKKEALEDLRPLVTTLDIPPDEKFDTMLLIIRSTDDQSLVQPAYEAAKTITDEKKRAEALLDIIKEIDYFSNQGNKP